MELKSSMYDLAWSVEGDQVELEQSAGIGEVSCMTLHATQVRLLAAEMGLMEGDIDAWRRVEQLEKRLRVLRDRIERLDGRLWSIPTYPPGANSEDACCIYSDATLDLANAFCDDLPLNVAPALGGGQTQREPNGNQLETRGLPAGSQASLLPEAR